MSLEHNFNMPTEKRERAHERPFHTLYVLFMWVNTQGCRKLDIQAFNEVEQNKMANKKITYKTVAQRLNDK